MADRIRHDVPDAASGRRVVLIVNPGSGRGSKERLGQRVCERLEANGCACDVVETAADGDACDAARQAVASGQEVVVAIGGDGTLHEVVHGVMDAGGDAVVGHVPAGTTNAVARALGIPLDAEAAADVIAAGHVRRLDLGHLPDRDRYFLLAVAIGDPARIVSGATRRLKSRWGMFAYYWAAVRMMAGTRQTRVRLKVDGRPLTTRASGVVIANFGRLEKPQLDFFPQSRPDDALLEIAIMRARGAWDWLRIGVAAVRGRGAPPRVDLLTGSDVHVQSARPRLIQADGEVLGVTPVAIALLPGALRFLAPDEEATTP